MRRREECFGMMEILPQRSTRGGGREIVIMFIIGHVGVLRSEDESV